MRASEHFVCAGKLLWNKPWLLYASNLLWSPLCQTLLPVAFLLSLTFYHWPSHKILKTSVHDGKPSFSNVSTFLTCLVFWLKLRKFGNRYPEMQSVLCGGKKSEINCWHSENNNKSTADTEKEQIVRSRLTACVFYCKCILLDIYFSSTKNTPYSLFSASHIACMHASKQASKQASKPHTHTLWQTSFWLLELEC